jgi:hypothetical protein
MNYFKSGSILVLSLVAIYGVYTWNSIADKNREQEYKLAQQQVCMERGKAALSRYEDAGDFVYYEPEAKCLLESIRNNGGVISHDISDVLTGSIVYSISYSLDYPAKPEWCEKYNQASLKYFSRKGPC